MKGLHISLSAAAIALLMVGCGVEDIVETVKAEATKVTNSQAQVKSSNAFGEISLYKTDAQMKKAYPNAYALDKNFNFDINKVSNFEVVKENMKAKVEALYLEYTPNKNKTTRALRVINGSKAKLDDVTWNFIVSLQADNQHFCGGSLIDKEWVLTAAHCVSDDTGKASKTMPSILTSTYSIKDGGKYFTSDAIYVHPTYALSNGDDGDIALVHLGSPIQNAKIVSISTKAPQEKMLSKVAGWGNMSTTSLLETTDLMEVVLPIINHDICKNSYATENMTISDGMICAGYMDGSKDSCQGDSGGPLIVNENGKNVLSGVVSFGGSQAQSCGAPNFPGVYTSVSSYHQWIKKYLSTNVVTTPVLPNFPTDKPDVNDGLVDGFYCDMNDSNMDYPEWNDNDWNEEDWNEDNMSMDEEYENDFTTLESELSSVFSKIDEAKTIDDLKNILKNFMASFMQIFS